MAALKDCLRAAAVAVQQCVANYSFGVESVGGGTKAETSVQGNINESGDKQLDLDVAADLAVEAALRSCPLIAGFLSEERKGFVEKIKSVASGWLNSYPSTCIENILSFTH